MKSKVAPIDNNNDLSMVSYKETKEEMNGHLRRAYKLEKFRSKCLINISNPWRVKWEIFLIALSLFNCFSIPYEVMFYQYIKDNITKAVLDIIIDTIFLLDILLAFRTAYINVATGEIVEDASKIARDYIRGTRFYIDLAASIPIGIITFCMNESNSTLQLIKVLKIFRVLRINKIILSMRVRDKYKIILRIFKLILFIIIYLHFIACLWYALVTSTDEWVPTTNSILSDLYIFYSLPKWEQYLYCMYIAVYSLVGIEISPQTTSEIAFCLVTGFTGAMFVSYILGNIADSVSSLNKQMNDFYENIGTARATMGSLKISEDVVLKVFRYMASTFQYQINLEEWGRFIGIIPPSYIRKVNSHLYRDLVKSQEILSGFPGIVEYMVKRLEFAFVNPDEMLICIGETSDRFYLVVDGSLDITVKDFRQMEKQVNVLKSGDIFGEIGLLFQVKRTATVIANCYSKVGMLNQADFSYMINEFSDLKEKLLEKVTSYNDVFRKGAKKILRRLPYIRRASLFTLDKVILNLKTHTFPPGTVIIEHGAKPSHLFLLIEGTLNVKVQLNDRFLFRAFRNKRKESTYRDSFNVFAKKEAEDKLKILSKHNKYMTVVDLDIIEEGSILCANQCIIGNKVQYQCSATSTATFLLLKTKVLENLAQIDPGLKAGLQRVKAKYTHYNDYLDQYVMIPSVLDYVKAYPKGTEIDYKKKQRLLKKVRDVAMMIVLRFRKKIKSNTSSFSCLVKKMNAVLKAQDKGWNDVARLIEKERLQPEVIESADLLKDHEVVIPLLTQFASIANKIDGLVQGMELNISGLSKEIGALNQARDKVEQVMIEINTLLK